MLGKLMKYEFKATGRTFLPLYAALVIVSVINRIFASFQMDVPSSAGTVAVVVLIVGILVITLLLTLDRFYKNLLQNEGYLMLTLPVKTESLILSKLLVSTIWFVVSFTVVSAAVSIMLPTEIPNFSPEISDMPTAIVTFCVVIAYLFMSILTLYACMSLSLLVGKHRKLFSFGAFIVITTIMQIVTTIGISIGDSIGILSVLDGLEQTAQQQLIMLGCILLFSAGSAILFLITRHMLKNKLNLQ